MSKEIKIERSTRNCDDKSLDKVTGAFTPHNEVMEEDKCPTAERMRKEFPELSKNVYEDVSDIFETKPKSKSVLKEYQKDITKNIVKKKFSESVLTPEEEGALKEKFVQEKTDEIMKQIEALTKEYIPGENVDKTKKINDLDLIRTVATLFGLKKCFEPTEQINEHKKETYVKPMCEVKFEPGEQPPVYAEVTFEDIANELIELHRRKNNDYGDAAHQSYKEFGITSYIIRLNDKMNRLKALTKPGATMKVQDESIIDTLKDLAAYAIMAIESLSTWR